MKQKKSTTLKKHPHNNIKLASLAVATAAVLSSGGAWADDCGVEVGAGGAAQCNGSIIDPNAKLEIQGNFVNNDLVVSVIPDAGGGNGALKVNNANILNNGVSHGILVRGDMATLDFRGTNTILLDATTSDTGVLVSSTGAGGATLKIYGNLDLVNLGNSGIEQNNRDGLEVNAGGEGSAKLEFYGSGSISTLDGHAILLNSYGGSAGDVDVFLGGSTELKTLGKASSGIRARVTNAVGSATIDSNAQINTTGESAHGIYVDTAGGKIDITNDTGEITTLGNSAHAIYGLTNAIGLDSAGSKVTLNGGILKTSGADAHGVALHSKSISGDMTVIANNTEIDVKGTNSDGIHLQRLGSGNITDISNVNINITTNNGKINVLDSAIAPSGGSNYGIVARQYDAAAGNITITNNGTEITTGLGADATAANSTAIDAQFMDSTATGNLKVVNKGKLKTSGVAAYGIAVFNRGSGTIVAENNALITVEGNNSSGIRAVSEGAGDVSITHLSGAKIVTLGNATDPTGANRADALLAQKSAGTSGNILITVAGDIETVGQNRAAGALAQHHGVGNATVIGSGNIDTHATTPDAINAVNIYSYGLAATQEGTGNATVEYSTGTITTAGNDAYALYAGSGGTTGDAIVSNFGGTLQTTGQKSYGIWSRNFTTTASQGNATAFNSGSITTEGNQAHGILAESQKGNVTITNDGPINIKGTEARGIYARGAAGSLITINNTGNIIHDQNTASNYGIDALVSGNDSEVTINHNGVIQGSRFGIVAWDGGTATTGNKSTINIGSQGTVDAIYGVTADMSAENTVNIDYGGQVNGSVHAIWFRGNDSEVHSSTLNNAGLLTSNKDQTIAAISNNSDTELTINNQITGEIVGTLNVNASHTTVNNAGLWNIQDRFNNTATVALGSHADNTFNNTGVINFNNPETVISGVETFNMNGGVLNLQARPGAGVQVRIGQTIDPVTGVVSGGTFVSNGGLIKMDVALGDDQSITDRIYVDKAIVGPNGITRILVNNDGGLGALTNEGIQIIDVKTPSNESAFELAEGVASTQSFSSFSIQPALASVAPLALANTVVAGAYEYVLVYKTQTNGLEGWHLTSKVADINPIVPVDPVTPPDFIWNHGWDWINSGLVNPNTPIYRPDAGVNLGNQQGVINGMIPGLGSNVTSAIGAGSSGGMRAAARLSGGFGAIGKNGAKISDSNASGDNGSNNSGQNGSVAPQKSNSLWSFATVNTTKGKAGNKQIDYTADSSTLQIGADTSFDVGDGLVQVGLMAAYGKVETESQNMLTRSTGTGEVSGYSVGIYGTWYANKDSMFSPYVDTYLTHGWYNNEVSTRGNATAKYRSNATSVTVQAGYPIALGSSVVLEPQAQITYLHYSSKDYKDHSGTRVSNELKGNTVSRVGTYLYGATDSRFKPYVAMNVWYDNTNSIVKYNDVAVSSDKKGMVLEAKVGFQAQATPDLTFWGEVGIRKGKNNFKDVGGSVGLKYRF